MRSKTENTIATVGQTTAVRKDKLSTSGQSTVVAVKGVSLAAGRTDVGSMCADVRPVSGVIEGSTDWRLATGPGAGAGFVTETGVVGVRGLGGDGGRAALCPLSPLPAGFSPSRKYCRAALRVFKDFCNSASITSIMDCAWEEEKEGKE